jgi:DNA-binding transcriptional ArsR family regulator
MATPEHPDRRIFVLQAEICRALAHPVRLEVLHLLGSGQMSFGDLLQRTEVTKTKLSQHLAVLRRARIVTALRDGGRIFYRLTYPEIERACEAVTQVLTQHLAHTQNETSALLRRVGGAPRR